MTSPLSAVSKNECRPGNHTLQSIAAPAAEDLKKTQQLYEETVLRSSEREYMQELLTGEGGSYIPAEFRSETASRIAGHLLQSEGKWIRATLCLLAARACGTGGESARRVAVAVELIHLATLIHDDVIDQAPIRRGIASVAGGWGNSVSVLLGDFLFSKAFKLLLSSGSVPSQKLLTLATGQMCLGEIKQLRYSTEADYKEKDYLEMIENKTASLMAAATASGAHLAGMDNEVAEQLHGYGHALGMAFQITDDVLDYTASTAALGKERGGDLRNGKVTLPLIHLYENDEKARRLAGGDGNGSPKTETVLRAMRENGSIEYAYAVGQRYGERAKECLSRVREAVGPSEALSSLCRLVDFVLNRTR